MSRLIFLCDLCLLLDTSTLASLHNDSLLTFTLLTLSRSQLEFIDLYLFDIVKVIVGV